MRIEPGFHHAAAADAAVEPFLALWAEVLRVGLEDARGTPRITGYVKEGRDNLRRRLHESACSWLACDDDDVGSFLWLCSLFDLMPELVRARVLEREELAA